MTKNDINVLYAELSKLLEDICGFLTDELHGGKLSVKAQHEADQLIQRSKKQLTAIAKVSPSTDNESGKYVDMHPIKAFEDDCNLADDMNQIYSAIEETKFGENASTEAQCPYSLTPACDVPVAAKCGFLEKKEKFFFIEHQKKIYAFAHQNWMAMYHSKKDHKPFFTINLTTFQAKKVEGPKEKKELFQLNCQMDHTKIYIFTATTEKDALQWVAAINSPSNHGRIAEEKDKDKADNVDANESENEYNETINVSVVHSKILEPAVIPCLPPRVPEPPTIKWDPRMRPVPNIPPPKQDSVEECESDLESNASYDEVITLSESKANHKKKVIRFDDEEDTEYDEVLNLPLPENAVKNCRPRKIEERLLPPVPKLKPKPSIKLFK